MDRFAAMAMFIKIVDTGSLSAAARALETTQPSISRQLFALERRLKVQLLRRNARHISLTEVGQAYYDNCKRLLADIDATESSLASSHAGPTGTLRVNTSVALGVDYIGPLACKFRLKNPELTIDLTLNERHVDLTEEGIDVAIRFGQVQDQNLVARRIGTTRLVTVASPSYLIAHGTPSHPRELATRSCVGFNYVDQKDWSYRGVEGSFSVRVASQFRSNNGHVLREGLVSGVGIGWLPEALIWQQVEAGSLKVLFPDFEMATVPVHAIYSYSAYVPTRVRTFVAFLEEQMRAFPFLQSI